MHKLYLQFINLSQLNSHVSHVDLVTVFFNIFPHKQFVEKYQKINKMKQITVYTE